MEPQAPEPIVDRPDPEGSQSVAPQTAGRLWAIVLLASTLAGLAAWGAGEWTVTHFIPPENLVKAMGQTINAPKFVDRAAAERKNASLANGILGGALGLALGLAGG